MKREILFSSLIATVILMGCNKQSTSPTSLVPLGTFTGKLVVIHKNGKTSKLDTVTSAVTLLMSASTGYALIADTSAVQSGSKGPFTLNDSQYITFSDQTAPTNAKTVGTSPKIHLNGTYSYGYDGLNFDFYASSDTLGYSYLLTKN